MIQKLLIFFKRIGIAILMFSICRILFLLFNWKYFELPPLSLFFEALRFDLSAVAYLFIPFTVLSLFPIPFFYKKWYQFILKLIFHLMNTICLMANILDFEYYKITFKRTTGDFFQFVATGDDLLTLLPGFIITYWYLFITLFILIWYSAYLYGKISVPDQKYSWKLFGFDLLFFIFGAALSVLAARGGFQHKPITVVDAGQHAEAQFIPVVLNTPFSILKTILEPGIVVPTYFSKEELDNIYSPIIELKHDKPFRKKNVVLIILESFSKEYMGYFDTLHKGYTPFLDSLFSESLVFSNCFANGKTSISALPAIFASVPTLMQTPYIISSYGGNRINSLATILEEKGYNSSFYHGGANGTMNFNGFIKTAGVDEYFGLDEYPNKEDFDGSWGILDEPYLQHFAEELNKKKQPFISGVFTLSSHNPYPVPEKYKDCFPKGDLEILPSIGYADFSLRRFFKHIQNYPWYKNTLFVITADHTEKSHNTYYLSYVGCFAVPFVVFDPMGEFKGVDSTLCQQTDIMPTILDLLNYSGKVIAFGNSVFNSTATHYSVKKYGNYFYYMEGEYMICFDGDHLYKRYWFRHKDVREINSPSEDQQKLFSEMEKKLKGIIQSYSERLIQNKLTIEN